MKHLLFLTPAASLLSFTACQQQSTTKAATVAAPMPAHIETTVAQVPAAAKPAEAPKPQLTPEMRAFFGTYNLASLLELDIERPEVQNGFYGAEHYRIEFVLLEVQQDATQPNVYHVRGKNRYKNVIMPLDGDITFEQVVNQPQYTAGKREASEKASDSKENLNLYSAIGRFELREPIKGRAAGVFSGSVAVDFHVADDNQLYFHSRNESAAQGASVKFEGIWKEYSGTRQQPVVWVYDLFSYGNKVLENFNIGEREVSINPKYAKLGWDTYWENDEWWAEPGTVTAQAAATDSL